MKKFKNSIQTACIVMGMLSFIGAYLSFSLMVEFPDMIISKALALSWLVVAVVGNFGYVFIYMKYIKMDMGIPDRIIQISHCTESISSKIYLISKYTYYTGLSFKKFDLEYVQGIVDNLRKYRIDYYDIYEKLYDVESITDFLKLSKIFDSLENEKIPPVIEEAESITKYCDNLADIDA